MGGHILYRDISCMTVYLHIVIYHLYYTRPYDNYAGSTWLHSAIHNRKQGHTQEELVLSSLIASPLMKPFLTLGGWHELKVYIERFQ